VERIVTDIDEIVKNVRFPDWLHTSQGERLVQKELRRTLLKHKLHTDQELFDKARSLEIPPQASLVFDHVVTPDSRVDSSF
jgi:hypothetical protein